MFDLTRRIAGNDADVVQIAPPKNVEAMREDRLAVMIGLGYDTWVEEGMREVSPKARVLKVGDRVRTLPLESDPSSLDPHVWMDPERARLMVKAIGEEMARAGAAHANAFRERANELDRALEALDQELETKIKAWKTKDVAAPTPVLAYLADRYGLHARTSGDAPKVDAFGGGGEATTYEATVRGVVSTLGKAQH